MHITITNSYLLLTYAYKYIQSGNYFIHKIYTHFPKINICMCIEFRRSVVADNLVLKFCASDFSIKMKNRSKKQTGNFLKRQEKHNDSKGADCFFYA